MSRRITLSVIATCAALSATPAFADNDCFDQTTCPPAEETLAREQRMLEERASELKAEEARAAQAAAQQAAEEQAAREQASRDDDAAKAQAAQTQRAMEDAARAQEQTSYQGPPAGELDRRAEEIEARNKAAEEQGRRDVAAQEKAAREQFIQEQVERQQQAQRDLAMREDQARREREQQRMPNVMEPPAAYGTAEPPVVAAPRQKQPAMLGTVTGIVPPVSVVPPKAIARPVEPAYEEPVRPTKPAKRVADTPRAQPLPVRPAPIVQPTPAAYEAPREPARPTYAAPIISSAIPVQAPTPQAPVQIVKGGKAATVVVVRDGTYEDGVTPVAPNVRPDPAMKFCQTEMRPDGRYLYCNQASYYPYGANGYRPLGTYQTHRTTPGYISAQPGPRIISLVTD